MRMIVALGGLLLLPAMAITAADPIPFDPGAGGNSLHPRALKPGDIILSTTASKLVSKPIREQTDSPVSHAIMCVKSDDNEPLVIEAVYPTVRRVKLSQAVSDAALAVAFRHPKINPTATDKILCYKDDVLCYIPASADKWFCSELVLSAYDQAQLTILLTDTRKKAPGELAKNNMLDYVGPLLYKL